MRLFGHLGLRGRILGIVAVACLICAVVAFGVSKHFSQRALEDGIVEKSRTIHSRLEAATGYVASQGGLKPIIDRLTQKYNDPKELTKEERLDVLKQVPIFAAMKIGAHEADKEHYTFRIFSDQPRKKENLATSDELAIFHEFESKPDLQEIVRNQGRTITVYRPVRLNESQGCLHCHGDPSNSPWKNGQDVLGFQMENWPDKKLHGVFAVITKVDDIKTAQASVGGVSNDMLLIVFIAFGSAVALALAALMARGDIERLRKVAATLSDASHQVGSAATEISSSSDGLSQATTEQASSLQQTAASITQMSSMVNKNSENAQRSSDVSHRSQAGAEKGQQVVQEMIRAIDEINQSNEAIMSQIDESNRQIGEIVKVIGQIATKTQVINDIVFQTKLLSFNASVEAARAGENGKGFAVVAEEVGNLAQMSGAASKEISALLDESIKKVESIVSDTKHKVESLVAVGKTKVEMGARVATECGHVLSDIVENVTSVAQMANEIASASSEQAQGVSEITRAMDQLDEVTQKNASATEQAAAAAGKLTEQAESLRAVVSELLGAIEGESKAA